MKQFNKKDNHLFGNNNDKYFVRENSTSVTHHSNRSGRISTTTTTRTSTSIKKTTTPSKSSTTPTPKTTNSPSSTGGTTPKITTPSKSGSNTSNSKNYGYRMIDGYTPGSSSSKSPSSNNRISTKSTTGTGSYGYRMIDGYTPGSSSSKYTSLNNPNVAGAATVSSIEEYLQKTNPTSIEKTKGVFSPYSNNVQMTDTLDLTGYSVSKNEEDSVFVRAGATFVTGCTSLFSGLFKIGEKIDDGINWLGGTVASGVVSLFDKEKAKEIQENVMNEIAIDKVGEMNKLFYEGTAIGRSINKASYLKYDSDVAMKIQEYTTKGGEIALATAATITTGGAAGLVITGGLGFASAAGGTAEKKFQDTQNREYWKDSLSIGVDGAIGAVSSIATGRAGNAAYQGIKGLGEAGILKSGVNAIKNAPKNIYNFVKNNGIKGTASSIKTGVSNLARGTSEYLKRNFGSMAKESATMTLTDKDFLLETGGVLLDDVKSGIETGNWDIDKMLLQTGAVYVSNYISNLAGGLLVTRIYEQNIGKPLGTNPVIKNNTILEDADSSLKLFDITGESNTKVNNPDDFFSKYNKAIGYYGADQNASNKYIKYGIKDPKSTTINSEGYVNYFIKEFLNQNPNEIITADRRKFLLKEVDSVLQGEKPFTKKYMMISYLTEKHSGDIDAAIKEFDVNFAPIFNNESERQLNILMKKGMSKVEAVKTLEAIDTTGICTYAAVGNSILYDYRDKPELFKKTFGFDMYTEIDGEKVLNSNELLIDMYTYVNSHYNREGFNSLFKNENGKLSINVLDTSKQVQADVNDYGVIENYLKSKNSGLSLNVETLNSWIDEKPGESGEFFKTVQEEGNNLILDIRSPKSNLFYKNITKLSEYIKDDGVVKIFNLDGSLLEETRNWDAGHAVFVTNAEADGLKIATWGQPAIIKYDNLQGTVVRYHKLHIGGID